LILISIRLFHELRERREAIRATYITGLTAKLLSTATAADGEMLSACTVLTQARRHGEGAVRIHTTIIYLLRPWAAHNTYKDKKLKTTGTHTNRKR